MKRLSISTRFAALGLLALAGAASAEPRTFMIDRAHSEVGFNVRHFFNRVHGRFNDYTGTIVYDPKNLTLASVEAVIRDTSIYTANDRRDAHLRTADFFWMEKYPTLVFKSDKVTAGKDSAHFQVAGNLTIRDITKPVVIEVEYLGMGPVAIGGNSMGTQAGFIGTTKVNRKDFGIVWNKAVDQGGVMLGDDVEIVLNIAAFSREEQPGSAPATGAQKK